MYRSNTPTYGIVVNSCKKLQIHKADLEKYSLIFPHSYITPSHFSNIKSTSAATVYAMELYYNELVFLTEHTQFKTQTPLHLTLDREKIEDQIFEPPPPEIDATICPCKQIFENSTDIKYEPIGHDLGRNLQVNLESVGLYSKYKDKLLFLSKLKCLSYDLETSFIPFSNSNAPFGKSEARFCKSEIISKFEILCSGLSSFLSVKKMLTFIEFYIPLFARKYNKSSTRLGWRIIEDLLRVKYELSPTLYDQTVNNLILDVYTPTIYLPKSLDKFFEMSVKLARLIEILHLIILFPLLSNLSTLQKTSNVTRGIFSQIMYQLVRWAKSTKIFAFNGSSFDNICTYKI